MKTVILAGGRGTRLAEETAVIPKPMVQIGNQPMLWHIMQIYARSGFSDFVVALGYKGDLIIDYFLRFPSHSPDVSVALGSGKVDIHRANSTDWDVRLVDTGLDTLTGGRLGRLEPILRPHGTFMLTYGDGVTDVDVARVLEFHQDHGRLATVTTVRPPARFGAVEFSGDRIVNFDEKPQVGEGWINGGFMVFEPGVFDYLNGSDDSVLEVDLLGRLAGDGELMGFRHEGFWKCMDTIRDKLTLEELWQKGAPWLKGNEGHLS